MPIVNHPRSSTARQGSALLAVGGILIALLLLAGWFFQYMMMQTRLSHRQEQQRVSTSLAFGLTVLAIQKIKQEILTDENTELAKFLRKPMDPSKTLNGLGQINESSATRIKLDQGSTNLQAVLDDLVEPLENLGAFSYEIYYSCNGADFEPIGIQEYPREKAGLVHLHIVTNFRKQNAPADLREEFHFAFRVKVTAALIPVLSKFTLYVEDARESSDPTDSQASFRLNVISTKENGDLAPTPTGKPWVFRHGEDPYIPPMRFADLVSAPRGLVYLGGGKLFLNLARGWATAGEFAEGFHLFAEGRGDGLYTYHRIGETYFMMWDQGICSENSGGSRDWFDLIRQSKNVVFAERNSAFRLIGVDQNQKKSPTLVLGEVFRSYICAKAVKNLDVPQKFAPHFLSYVDDDDAGQAWTNYINRTSPDEEDCIATFARDVILLDETTRCRDDYNKYFASDMAYSPYNRSLAFINSNNRIANPVKTLPADPLVEMMRINPLPDPATVHAVPAPFNFLDGVPDLKSMSGLMKGLGVPGPRTAWVINPAAEKPDLFDCLKARDLFDGQTLDLQGWVYVEGDTTLKIAQALKLGSNGGIVLQKGNISITNQIDANRGGGKFWHLQLVTLDGEIKVDTNLKVQATLVAPKGKVTVGTGGRPKIRGAVAMSRFDLGSTVQGAEVEYDPALAALPNDPAGAGTVPEEQTEKPLLGFSVNTTPIFLK